MQKHLYFVCPTDHLESVINRTFKQENYFCTSLGNSVVFDLNRTEEIKSFIEAKEIEKITFILSDTNQLVLDALRNQDFKAIGGLRNFYSEITRQKKRTEAMWSIDDLRIPILSYYLRMKVRELRPTLNSALSGQMLVDAKIFKRQGSSFSDVRSNLFCGEHFGAN